MLTMIKSRSSSRSLLLTLVVVDPSVAPTIASAIHVSLAALNTIKINMFSVVQLLVFVVFLSIGVSAESGKSLSEYK